MIFLPLQPAKIRFPKRILLALPFLAMVALPSAAAAPQAAGASATAVPVFVSDFELPSVPPPPASAGTPAPNQQNPKTPPASEDANVPYIQARRLTNFFAATLAETLKKSGYNARRTRGQLPSQGALLRGVFTEPDEKNRIRRELLGGTSVNTRFFLYVGIFNLARPDQPLYQLAPEQSPSSQFGPIVTLNTYIPLAKYELDKDPSEEDVRKICAQIVASLTALLAANAAAFSD
jgi:hypothetical protein